MKPTKSIEAGRIRRGMTIGELFGEMEASGNNVIMFLEGGDVNDCRTLVAAEGAFADALGRAVKILSEKYRTDDGLARPERSAIPAPVRHELSSAAALIQHDGTFGIGMLHTRERKIVWVSGIDDNVHSTPAAEIQAALLEASGGMADTVEVWARKVPDEKDGWVQFYP